MTEPVHPTVAGIGTSIVRTLVPLIVGALIGAAAKVGLDLDDGAIASAVTVIVTTGYYALVRVLETGIGPAWGWLLGVAKPPQYETPPYGD